MNGSGGPPPLWRHDILNQIGIIIGFTEMLLGEMDPSDPRRPDLQEISVAANRAMELVQQLKDGDAREEGP